jgi:hypothetical protein
VNLRGWEAALPTGDGPEIGGKPLISTRIANSFKGHPPG